MSQSRSQQSGRCRRTSAARDVSSDVVTAGSSCRTPATSRSTQALERLLAVPDLPSAEQVEVYVGVHRDLQDRLADLEE